VAKKTPLTRRITRRETLGLIGGAAVAAVVGCGGDDEPSATPEASATRTTSRTASASATTAAATTSATAAPVACVLTLEETEGPYFVDERLNRSDLTSDPSDGSVSEGVPLQLDLTVSEVNGATCTPIVGAVVDMWHCDALGSYSDVSAGMGQSSTVGRKFLRGYQVTDANGRVAFQTIYPGWYSGRTVHIHFKVRTEPDSQQGFEFTSQLFFDEAVTDAVIAQAPYNEKGSRDTTNSSDNIFDSSLIVPLTAQGGGYSGSFHAGVDFA
jgi:protocatechuate 3,4-dioxygenase beta subunit